MSGLSRIGKLFGAQNAGQLLTILTQLALPPAMLFAYKADGYGQWVALGSALTYLSTFNYGLQTYTNMQMTIHYNRGELQDAREVQSAGLRILLTTFVLFNTALLGVFLIPIDSWLHLTISQHDAQWTLYFLGCQIVSSMVFGFFSGGYMAISLAHRSANFANLNQLIILVAQVTLALRHAPFYYLAGSQLVVTLASALFLMFDFGRLAPDLRPTLRYWRRGILGQMLAPSAQYALLYSSNVLAYALPTLLIQRMLGGETVTRFNLTRTIYSMSRRILYLLTNSIGPEITLAFGQKDWPRMHRLYEFSERIILLMTVPVTFGTMLATPLLFQLWLHKPDLFDPNICLLLGITVSVLSIKEHKYQFQFSTNQVGPISYMTIVAYTLQLIIAVPMMRAFGMTGYLATWCINEILQLFFLLRLNERLFAATATVDRKPVYRLFALLCVTAAVLAWPLYHIRAINLFAQGALAAVVSLLLGYLSYRIFDVDEVRALLWQKIGPRLPGWLRRRQPG
jgi:O-antigen/teichoic acid export membrane protein